MFDYAVSKHPHFEEACRQFPARHNVTQLAQQVDMNAQTLRNKLSPGQLHQLTCAELLAITDATEDSSLLDAMLAQINCMPSVPVNEASAGNIPAYALHATAAMGSIAAAAVQGDHKTPVRKSALLESVNTAIRHLSLIGLTVQNRIQSTPALTPAWPDRSSWDQAYDYGVQLGSNNNQGFNWNKQQYSQDVRADWDCGMTWFAIGK